MRLDRVLPFHLLDPYSRRENINEGRKIFTHLVAMLDLFVQPLATVDFGRGGPRRRAGKFKIGGREDEDGGMSRQKHDALMVSISVGRTQQTSCSNAVTNGVL